LTKVPIETWPMRPSRSAAISSCARPISDIAARAADQHLSVPGRLHPARMPLEQLDPEQILHFRQQLGGGQLGHARRLGLAQHRTVLVQLQQQ